jgi:hypothetical protein
MENIYNNQKNENAPKWQRFLQLFALVIFIVTATGFNGIAQYNVTGTNKCAGETAEFGLDGSVTGKYYYLLRLDENNNYQYQIVFIGQGSAFNFAVQTETGKYEVFQYNTFYEAPVSEAQVANIITGAKQSGEKYIYALPVPVIDGNTVVCPNSSGNVYSTAAGKANYIWNVTGGTITAGGGNNDNTVTVTWGPTGTGHVYVSYTENGCNTATPTDYPVTIKSPVLNFSTNTGYLTLQAAIDAATVGDIIELVCNHTEGLVTVNKAVTIDGNGNTLTSTSATWGIGLEAVGINLHDLTLTGTGAQGIQQGCDANNLVMTNVTVTGCGGTGISIYGSDGAVLTNITSTNNKGNGLNITNCNNTTINGINTNGNAFSPGGFSAGIGLFTSQTYCLPAGINGVSLTGTISIAEPTKVYSEKANATDVITGLSGTPLTWAVGVGPLVRSYWPDKATSYAVVDAIFDASHIS